MSLEGTSVSTVRRLLVLVAFAPAAIGSLRLWQLPTYAAANGAGQGTAWTTSTIGFAVAVTALFLGVLLAWRLIERFPRLVATLPVLASLIALLARRFAAEGGPEEFYLLDDAKLWIVLLGLSVVLASLVAIVPSRRQHAAV